MILRGRLLLAIVEFDCKTCNRVSRERVSLTETEMNNAERISKHSIKMIKRGQKKKQQFVKSLIGKRFLQPIKKCFYNYNNNKLKRKNIDFSVYLFYC